MILSWMYVCNPSVRDPKAHLLPCTAHVCAVTVIYTRQIRFFRGTSLSMN